MLLSLLRYFFDDFGRFSTEASLVMAANSHAPHDVRRRVTASSMARRVPPRALIHTVHLNLASVRVRKHLLCRLCRGLGDLQGHRPAARRAFTIHCVHVAT